MTFAFSHFTTDVGLFAPSTGSCAFLAVFGALQSLAFTLGVGPLAFVCAHFSLVCRLLAVVGDAFPLGSNPFSLICETLVSCQLDLPSRQSPLALIKLRRPPIKLLCATIQLTSLFGIVLSSHDFPPTLHGDQRQWLATRDCAPGAPLLRSVSLA